ncbi:OmpP1/FadL family transporter [Sorangium sp. So ce513]|uniref:OmpP1/FadL family transporter n=1 Tax=Sorangium sp. So ce513 TaxID=3133315 RepID=UPI003F611869
MLRGVRRMWRGFAALLAAGLALAPPGAALASPVDVLGFGARASAMGATGAAVAEGYEAVHANPALLSLSRERRLTLGLTGAIFDLRAGDRRLSYAPLRGSVIGATAPVPFGGALADRVTIGLGFFAPFDVVVRGRILYPETPQFPIADRTQSVAVQAAIGAAIGRGIRVGGGFAALAALSGSVTVATDATGRVGTLVEDTLVASYAPIVGASYDLGAYRLGATFRGELVGRFDVVIRADDLGGIAVPPLHIAGIAQYDPAQIALEAARVEGPWKVAIGATYKRWSDYPGPVEATVRCPEVDPGTGEPFTGSCAAPSPADPGYVDTLVPRVGVERSLALRPGATAHARGGAFFEASPAPEQTGASNAYDNARLGLSLGYGLSLAAPLPRISLDLFAEVQLLLPRAHRKRGDAGAGDTAAGDAGAGDAGVVRTRGALVAGGTTVGVVF